MPVVVTQVIDVPEGAPICCCGEASGSECLTPPDVSESLNIAIACSNPNFALSATLTWQADPYYGFSVWYWEDYNRCCQGPEGSQCGILIRVWCNPPETSQHHLPQFPVNAYVVELSSSMLLPDSGSVAVYSMPTVVTSPFQLSGSWSIHGLGGPTCGGDATATYVITEA